MSIWAVIVIVIVLFGFVDLLAVLAGSAADKETEKIVRDLVAREGKRP